MKSSKLPEEQRKERRELILMERNRTRYTHGFRLPPVPEKVKFSSDRQHKRYARQFG